MSQLRVLVAPPAAAGAAPLAEQHRQRVRWIGFSTALLLLSLVFARTLRDLCAFAWDSSLYSHVPLVPLISAYLARTKRRNAPTSFGRSIPIASAAFLAAATLVTAAWGLEGRAPEDALSFGTAAFIFGLYGLVAWFFGPKHFIHFILPLGFLGFMVPLPSAWIAEIEAVLQHGSAAIASALFRVSGTPVFYEALNFQLPGVSLHVAPECSGIHSTLALFIVSVLAAHWFVRSAWSRLAVALFVFPLALIRNGFRIFVVGELCVHGGPGMIDSPIHRQGGPLFFALSLVPFLLLLLFLIRWEQRAQSAIHRTRL